MVMMINDGNANHGTFGLLQLSEFSVIFLLIHGLNIVRLLLIEAHKAVVDPEVRQQFLV